MVFILLWMNEKRKSQDKRIDTDYLYGLLLSLAQVEHLQQVLSQTGLKLSCASIVACATAAHLRCERSQ